MYAVDEAVRLVQLSAQRGSMPAVVGGSADGRASASALRRFELARDLGDLFAQFPK
jgi:hypothetical protein